MTVKTGAFVRTAGVWTPTIIDPNGDVIVVGEFATREEAKAAYIKKRAELYPPEAPPVIDPNRHHALRAEDILTSPFVSNTLH